MPTTKPAAGSADIRVNGPEDTCRAVLDTLTRGAYVTQVRGPFPRRWGGDKRVRFSARVIPRQMASEPGS